MGQAGPALLSVQVALHGPVVRVDQQDLEGQAHLPCLVVLLGLAALLFPADREVRLVRAGQCLIPAPLSGQRVRLRQADLALLAGQLRQGDLANQHGRKNPWRQPDLMVRAIQLDPMAPPGQLARRTRQRHLGSHLGR